MTSEKGWPKDYYNLPFCQPENGVERNTGRENTPFVLKFKEDTYCQKLCITNLGRGEREDMEPNKVVKAIREDYHAHFIVDDLRMAEKEENEDFISIHYDYLGYPIGFINASDSHSYVHNHINIEIEYHATEGNSNEYNIVGFDVEPFSVKHEFELDPSPDEEGSVKIHNPIESCDPTVSDHKHTDYDMIFSPSHNRATTRKIPAQEASGKVLFTYDVIWTENTRLSWEHRWDRYQKSDPMTKKIMEQMVQKASSVLLLLAMVAIVLIYAVRRRMRLATMRQAGAAVVSSPDDLEMSNVTQSYEDDSPSSTQRRSSRPETISAEE